MPVLDWACTPRDLAVSCGQRGNGHMSSIALNVLIVGAHPDDPDLKAAGVAALYSQRGHRVKMLSLTNGDAGHYEMGGAPLAWRRREEAVAAGACVGAEYVTLDNHDGRLMPSLENREQVIRIIREFKPDLVMAPRPYDYHPDHRCVAQLVQDAIYLVTVPNIVSDVPHLRKMPVAVYLMDAFQRPYPFVPDVVVGIDEVVGKKLDALNCHVSQMYEWLPYNRQDETKVPEDPQERRAWLYRWLEPRFRRTADLYRDKLIELYGEEKGKEIEYAEAFEASEYGTSLTGENLHTLFPFF